MDRRTYIAGFGSLAAGGAVLGTAATTTFNANDRKSGVKIVADNPEGAIGFDIQNTNSEVINETGDDSGQVEIDLGEASGTSEIGDTGATGSGVNVGSVVNVGTLPTEPSLKIINQTSSDNVEFTFDFHNVSGTGLGSSGLNLSFEFQDPAGNVEQAVIDATSDAPTITSGDGSGSTGALNNLDAGQVYDFALTVDADGATTSANISLDLDIIAVTP
jgi:hypothetical protein